jgi:ribonucleoside-diphosphate reductase alpha chain
MSGRALSENALKVLRARYLLKDLRGKIIETPEQMFRRVAKTMAEAESKYGSSPSMWEERFFELMSDLRFLPNSPALMNAGKKEGQLAACFVLPVEDSMKSIFGTLKDAALILKSGGGTGFSFSSLRPSDDIVSTTGGVASGPVSFMRIYNTATDVIKQGGARRGANMGILRVDHPDILEFIRLKRETHELENFNISVSISDNFMRALKANRKYSLVHPHTGKRSNKKLPARDVFKEIVRSAWLTGDPGVVFIDTINRENPTPNIGHIECTNPCGEQPLLPYEACVLGSFDLSKYVTDTNINYEKLKDDISSAVRMLDDAIDVNNYPLEQIEEMHKGNRKIGIGVMGWADMLVLLGISYGSDKALILAGKLMKIIQSAAWSASAELAVKRGVFRNFKGSVFDKKGGIRPRNATVTTIAPTGTLSIIAGCSSGIEPLFALSNKRMAIDTVLFEENRKFIEIAKEKGFYSRSLMKQVRQNGNLKGIKGIPAKIKNIFKTAHEINPEQQIRMQSAFQKYTDNAVSKTINLKEKATKNEVEGAFMLAYELGCKGITVFRYGSAKPGTLLLRNDK